MGGNYAYDDDIGLDITTFGGGSVRCPSRSKRRIVALGDGDNQGAIKSVITEEFGAAGLNHLYNPTGTTYTLVFQSWAAYAGSNVWAKARVRTWQISNGLVVREAPFIVKHSSNAPIAGMALRRIDSDINKITLLPNDSELGLWSGGDVWIPWNVKVQRGKWCYWIIDFVWVKMPDYSSFKPK